MIGYRDHDGLGDGHEVTTTLTTPDDFDSEGESCSGGAAGLLLGLLGLGAVGLRRRRRV